jgi:hypothetical protein
VRYGKNGVACPLPTCIGIPIAGRGRVIAKKYCQYLPFANSI